uniref:Uncharacterized protein n=1 Tax=Paulinella chromatophora TaxID=39717 RepID=B1X4F2_PAUCH|nr:hypothetical protein PCC_0381 [Paulinella chromatophora]ACB42821.1 hypothetical protein PCC_0381 [Paulinella chromatophora]
MSSGRDHDKITCYYSLPFAILCAFGIGWKGFIVGGGTFLIGGLLFSPDLDIKSYPSRRWGLLSIIWRPYCYFLSHRSLLSHSPLLGTAGRVTYIIGLYFSIHILIWLLFSNVINVNVSVVINNFTNNYELLSCALVSIEISAWLHLLQDS